LVVLFNAAATAGTTVVSAIFGVVKFINEKFRGSARIEKMIADSHINGSASTRPATGSSRRPPVRRAL